MGNIIKKIDSNVVIIAQEFNLSIMNNVWLYKNKIFTEDELKGQTSIPVLVEIQTENFQFSLIPNRLKFSINPKYEDPDKLLTEKVAQIVKTLPHTPYTACGFNFTYHVVPEDQDVEVLSRSLFFKTDSKLMNNFDISGAKFGSYFSIDAIGTRLKLDIKPMTVTYHDKKEEALQFAFNFHLDISSDDDYKSILHLIEKWDEAESLSKKIMDSLD